MWTTSERFFALLDEYSSGIEPLENWDINDLLDLQQVIEEELEERGRIAQNEYFESYGGTE